MGRGSVVRVGRGFGGEGGQRVRRWGWGEGSEVRVGGGFRW